MTQTNDQDDLDALLRRAMRERPLPTAPTNLAARAARLGREQEVIAARVRMEYLARRRRWNVLTSVAATVLVAAVVYFGAARIQTNPSNSTTSQSNSTDSSNSSSSSSQESVLTVAFLLTGEGLLVALILLSTASTSGPWTQVRLGY